MKSARMQGGFTGGMRKQGGWIGAVIGAVVSLYSANKNSKDKKAAAKQVTNSDPYGPYRASAAAQLQALQNDPNSIVNTAEYKARQTATARLIASQGYTGSGNAIAAAAEAGGASYQQAFNNLAAEAGVGAQPGGSSAALGYAANANDNYLSSIAGVGNNLAYLANAVWNKPASNTGSSSGNGSGSSGSSGDSTGNHW